MDELEIRRPRALRLTQLMDVKVGEKTDGAVLKYDGARGNWNAGILSADDVGAAALAHTHAGEDITSAVSDALTLNGHPETDFATADHTHLDATSDAAGFMSAEDKAALDELVESDGGALSFISGHLPSSQTLSSSYFDVVGCSLTLSAGIWFIVGTFAFHLSGTVYSGSSVGSLVVNSTRENALATYTFTNPGLAGTATFDNLVCQNWIISASSGTIVTLQAKTDYAGGDKRLIGPDTHITALCLAPS